MKIRFARLSDTDAILKIYSQYIDTPITFELVLPSKSAFIERIKTITSTYPYLVCEDNEKIIGYAYAQKQREREAYQWNAELSIYIDKNFVSQGFGKKMYTALTEILKEQGIKTVYGGVTLPNEKSKKLHLSLGFKPIGIYHNTGYKCGTWLDVLWFEKTIAPYTHEPKSIVSINEIDDEKIKTILNSINDEAFNVLKIR